MHLLGLCRARSVGPQHCQLPFSGPLLGACLCWPLHTYLQCIYGLLPAWVLCSCKVHMKIVPLDKRCPSHKHLQPRRACRTLQLALSDCPRAVSLALQARLFCGAPPGEGQPPRRSPRPRVSLCDYLAPTRPAVPYHPLRVLLWRLLGRRLHSSTGFLGLFTEAQAAVLVQGLELTSTAASSAAAAGGGLPRCMNFICSRREENLGLPPPGGASCPCAFAISRSEPRPQCLVRISEAGKLFFV